MNTIRQLLRVRSIVLATALVSLLLAAMSTPASAQGVGIFVANRTLSLTLGTAADGSPAVIASEIGDYWTTFPALAQPMFNASLGYNDEPYNPQGLPSLHTGLSGTPTTIIITWAYPIRLMGRGTHIVTFAGGGSIAGADPGSADHTKFALHLTVTVP